MEFLFRHRGAGKRQVKPSQDIALLEDQMPAESSDDSEYQVDSDHKHSNESNDGNESSGSSSNANSSDEDAEGNDDDTSKDVAALRKDDHETLTTRELVALARQEFDSAMTPPSWISKVKICGCCLGQTSTEANEIVECDGCGVSVHEGCYGITESAGSIASTVSSASTEPWFCEPCRAGLEAAPACQLCPIVGGVYKQTDVGRWVHLVCALYVPGVAFGDPDNMTKVTVFEMNYISWGRRVCSICAASPSESEVAGGVRLSRTGVCIQCDAGLCKAYFHPSCAQASGLLSEPTYVTTSVMSSAEAVMDAYLAHCKVHTDRTVIKRRRRSYLVHLVQSRLRRPLNKIKRASEAKIEGGETADERILRKLARSRVHYVTERSRGHEPWVPTQKLPRLLTTSASAIRKIQRMGELHDVDIARQVRQEVQVMSIVEAKKKWGVAPAFNVEFVAYYEDREKRIDALKRQVVQDQHVHERLRSEDSQTTEKYDKATKVLTEVSTKNSALRKRVEALRTVLGLGGLEIPKAAPALPSSTLAPSSSLALRARATAFASQHNIDSSRHLKACGICQKSHDPHLLAHCDTCQLFYHLGCLTPPLTRMPKKSKLYGWSCSECYPDSSDDDLGQPQLAFDEDLITEGLNRRRRQRRVAASKALVMANSSANNSDEDNLLLQKVMAESKKPPEAGAANGLEVAKADLIAKAEAKAERKRQKKVEKARRKAERKKQKLLETANEQHPPPPQNGGQEDDSDIEILEDENGVCTVQIKPKPIKLTIKTGINGSSLPDGGEEQHDDDEEPSEAKRPRRSTPLPAPKDVRRQCDKCETPGGNINLVRCDECKRCYHFGCLNPPLKKNPKVPGYGWHCNECDPSDRDSDWNLD